MFAMQKPDWNLLVILKSDHNVNHSNGSTIWIPDTNCQVFSWIQILRVWCLDGYCIQYKETG